ncbi:MAG TPA: spore coat protein [Thermoanaerobacterales bacterium]|nr:spore coat protein [Thermoanaerobacterales bacterium]
MNLNDRDIAYMMLNQHKHEAATLTNFILECSNEQLRMDAQNALEEVFSHQKQIFDIMNQRGWYQIQPADQQQLSKAQQSISTIEQNMMQM